MNDNTAGVLVCLMGLVCLVLFVGEPDMHDALLAYLQQVAK